MNTTDHFPRPGDIGLTQISGVGGKLIRLGQFLNGDGYGDFEHAFVYVGNGEIIEAMPGGAQRVKNWHDFTRVEWLTCPDGNRAKMVQVAYHQVGVPYSFADYASLAAHRFHLPARHLDRFIGTSGHMICSQLVDYCADMADWHLFKDGRWPGDVTPGDLHKLYKETH